ncbi:NAD dependent epimerase/dehydratase [Spirochaetia bacterium]|nr:NAD dependent epimerase/dehydratase [Spirochaetia bacterium]
MKKAIVTGANGFIGSAVTQELIENGTEVIAMDLSNTRLPQSKLVHFYAMDLQHIQDLDVTSLKKEIGEDFDVFYHFAWAGSAGKERANTVLQLQNAQWTIDCLRLAKNIGCKRFVCAGSIMEYETIAAIFAQGNRPGPGYIYGAGKLFAHTISMSFAAGFGIDVVWAMLTNAYGVGELSSRFINSTIRKILKGEPLQFTVGTQNYDFVYITDVARAFRLIGEKGKPFYHYLIGSSNAKPLKEFVLEMKSSIAPEGDFVFGDIPFTGANTPLAQFDCSETEADTGFRAEISFAEGVKKTMEWLKKAEVL